MKGPVLTPRPAGVAPETFADRSVQLGAATWRWLPKSLQGGYGLDQLELTTPAGRCVASIMDDGLQGEDGPSWHWVVIMLGGWPYRGRAESAEAAVQAVEDVLRRWLGGQG